ncbi:MAG: queuosine precursor transporter [Microbacteriaceae bacterium]|nr:queuosine precursor transporter [Microbacteriaceae bacterium]MCI1206945.1 queuosine precursor transporter [Microbacteriaceae bacterium]
MPHTEQRPRFASASPRYFPIVMTIFASLYVVSNIAATKGVLFGPIGNFPIYTDGGFLLFPLTYVLGDVLSEVYGFRRARLAIAAGFAINIGAVLYFQLVLALPGAPGYTGQHAFREILGLTAPRILIASLTGYALGQLLNSVTLVLIKRVTDERLLWVRLIGSTVVGEFADTLAFCLIAAPVIGIHGFAAVANYTVLGFLYKTLLEVVLLPITYPTIGWLKRHEPDYLRPSERAVA